MISWLVISEFAARREAQPDFTSMKDEAKKKEEADAQEEADVQEEAEKTMRDRVFTKDDLIGPPEDLLSLSENASEKEIKRKFRILVKLVHPDKNPDKKLFGKGVTSNHAFIAVRKALHDALDKLKRKNDKK